MASRTGCQAHLLWGLVAACSGLVDAQTTTTAATAAATTTTPPTNLEPNCLVNATFLPHQRTNVIFNRTSMPLMVSHYTWDSSRILSEIYLILVREVLGKNVEVARTFGTSKKGYRAISGCQDPEAASEAQAQCGVPGPQKEHVLIECWDAYASSAMNYIRDNYVEQSPIRQGECGFPGRDGMFVSDASLEPAMRQEHLPLEYYNSYSNPYVDSSQFFDSPWSINTTYLRFCNETGLSGFAEKYYQLFHDDEGVIVSTVNGVTTYTANCTSPWPHWWLSPACRRDTTKCIPWISADYGWYADVMMQRAAAWDIPVAIATGKQYSDYTTIPKVYKTQFFWWFPDTEFILNVPQEIIWPPYDKGEWDQGNMRTDNVVDPTRKWSYYGLAEKGNDGFTQPLALLRNMQVGYQEIYGILQDVATQSINTPAKRRQYACDWLNNNVNLWMQWKPEDTACIEGRGLVNRAGEFVYNRNGDFDPSLNKANAGEASGCEWCRPGNYSERLSDTLGITHRCTRCADGLFQASLGMTACESCNLGEVPAPDKSSCVACPKGRYANRGGLTTCTPCPEGFTTSVLGATDISACICKEGRYRLALERMTCDVCKEGMRCAEGSDMLNIGTPYAVDPVANPAPVVKAGFWASHDAPVNVFACDSIERCPGGPPGRACSPHLEGQACGTCADGYSWAGDRCERCGSKGAAIFVFPVLPLILAPIVICFLYKFGGDTYSKWGSWQNGLTSMLFIVLNHYQVVSILSGVNVLFPNHLVRLLRAFTFTSDLLGVFNPACAGLREFKHAFILRCLGPLILAGIYAITVGVSHVIARLGGKKFESVKMNRDRTLNGYFSLILTFFIALSESCFAILKCAPNPNDTESLLVDRSITCDSDEWNALVIAGGLSLVIWIGGFGALFVRAIILSVKHFHDPGVQMRWKFLFIRYRPDVHYWAISFVLRGILLNLGFTFIRSGLGQILWLLGVLSTYAGLMFMFRPWRHMMNNFMDLWAHLNLCMACSASIWFTNMAGPEYALANQEREGTVSAFFMVTLFMILAPFFPAVFTMYWAQTSQSALTKKYNELCMIMDSFDQVNAAEVELRREFLWGLDEIDFWFMGMAKDILQTEFAKRRCRTGYSDKKLNKVPLGSIREIRSMTTEHSITQAQRTTQLVERAAPGEMQFVDV